MIARWDEWELDIPARRVTGSDGSVHVEPQVFDVLVYLVENRDRVVPKEELLDEIWGDQFVSESALTTRIKSARKAIGDDGRTQRYIRNVPGRGYQFVGSIDESRPSSGSVPGNEAQPLSQPLDLAMSISLDIEFPFVGRANELTIAKSRISGGNAGSLLIGGEPGIGKSRLAVELLEHAQGDGALACAGRCEEYVSAPLQPIRDAVGQLAGTNHTDFQTWATGMESQLIGLVPSLTGYLAGLPVAVDGYTALEVLSTLFDRVGETRPVVILVDDLQWSDEPTRAFLSRAGRRSNNRSTICTFRTTAGDLPNEVANWIASEARNPRSTRFDLRGLDEESTRTLVSGVLGEDRPEDADQLMAQTGGHSLFLTESLRDILTGGTLRSSVGQMVNTRLTRLERPVQALVRAGAFLGPEFSFTAAGDAAGLDPMEAIAAVDVAVNAELLHESASSDRFRFSHQLVPQAIRSSMSQPAAAAIHHRCVAALERAGATEVEIAHHLLGSVPLIPLTEAVTRCRDIAADALTSNEYDNAIRVLENLLAFDLDSRTMAEVTLDLGRARNNSGRASQAIGHFEDAAALAREHGWVDVLVEAAMGHYHLSPYRTTGGSTTLELLAEADAALGDPVSVAKAKILAKTAVFSQFRLPLAVRDEMTEQALGMAADADPLDRMALLECRAIVLSNPAGVRRLGPLDAELKDLRDRDHIYFADAAVPETRLLMLGMGKEFRLEALSDETRLRSQPITEWRRLVLNSTLRAFEGDLETAGQLCDEAGSIGEQFWGDASRYLHALGQVFVAELEGKWDRALELLEPMETTDPTGLATVHAAWAHLSNGDPDHGLRLADSFSWDRLGWFAEHILGGNALVAAAEVALLADNDEMARTAERHLTPFADLMLGVPWACSLAAADPLSRLAKRRGDTDLASTHTATARDIYRRLSAPTLLARVT